MKRALKTLILGIIAGIMISIGGAVYLACSNKYVGALLFCVALASICYGGFYLYTGKIGYVVYDHKINDILDLAFGIIGNAIGVIIIGEILRFAIPSMQVTAETNCLLKLDNTFWQWLAKGTMCGILMYIAVSIYKNHNKNVIGILLCIPTFILCGFEHSIADMFYMAIAGIATGKAVGFLFTIILGNTIGAIIIPLLLEIAKKFEKKEEGC